jgi:GNAT superfamily N-acetyltransferase
VHIEITEFSDAHSKAAIDLVVGIQRDEFGFPVSADQQPDLLDVAGHYRSGSGNFWVALANDRLVGTIGLLDLGGGLGSLRKMFVLPEFRGAGVAPRLLERLLDWARTHEFATLYLGTTSKYHAAHRFYEKNGFTRLPAEGLPEGFPRFDIEDRFYSRSLTAKPAA